MCGHPTVTTIGVCPAFVDDEPEETGLEAASLPLLRRLVSDLAPLVAGQPHLFPALQSVSLTSQHWLLSFVHTDVDTRQAQAPAFTAMARELRAVGVTLLDEYDVEWDKAWDVDAAQAPPAAPAPAVDDGEQEPELGSDDELVMQLPAPAPDLLDGEQEPAPGSDDVLVVLPAAP